MRLLSVRTLLQVILSNATDWLGKCSLGHLSHRADVMVLLRRLFSSSIVWRQEMLSGAKEPAHGTNLAIRLYDFSTQL